VAPAARVLYLDHCARMSGGEIALARLVDAIPDLEAEVILGEDGPVKGLLEKAGAKVTVLPLDETARDLRRASIVPSLALVPVLVQTIRYTLRIAREIRRRSPDLVVTNSLKSALYGGFAARLARVPVVWHMRDHVGRESLTAPAVLLVRLAARFLPCGVIANSESTLASLRIEKYARAGAERARRRGPSDDERERARKAPAFAVIGDPCPLAPVTMEERKGGPLTVAMVGRLCPWKGQHLFLEAFARSFAAGDERAVIVGGALFGEQEYASALEEQVRSLGLCGRVDLVGHVDDVSPYYERADVLVHASTAPEPFGQVLVEAMGHGNVVLAARAGGPTEILTHGVDGLLYTPGDVDELSRALHLVASDEELRVRLGSSARKSAVRFTPARIGPRTKAAYYDMIRRARQDAVSKVPA